MGRCAKYLSLFELFTRHLRTTVTFYKCAKTIVMLNYCKDLFQANLMSLLHVDPKNLHCNCCAANGLFISSFNSPLVLYVNAMTGFGNMIIVIINIIIIT